MKYNKGDKVRVIDHWGDSESCEVGDICTVVRSGEAWVSATNDRTGQPVHMLSERFEPYTEPRPSYMWGDKSAVQISTELHQRIDQVFQEYHAEQEAKQRAEAAAKRKLDPDWRPEPGEEYCRRGANGEAKLTLYKGQLCNLANLDNAYPPEQFEELQESLRQRQRMMDLTRELGRPGKEAIYGWVVNARGERLKVIVRARPRWMQVVGLDAIRKLQRAFTAEQVQLIIKYL